MSTLIICLPSAAYSSTATYDYVNTPDGRTMTSHASGLLALLPAAEQGGDVVAVVPISLLSWHAVELPKGVGSNSPRLRAILENLLEERLLDEPAQLHLALAPGPIIDGSAWVAACDRNWLRGHLHALETAGRPVARIVPEFAPETGSLQLTVIGEMNMAQLVVTGQAAGGVVRLPLNTAALALVQQRLNADSDADADSGNDMLVFAEPGVSALAENLLQCKVSLLTRQQRWLEASRSNWDLAQFDLVNSGRARIFKRLSSAGRELLHAPGWRPARWGTALFLVVNLLGLNLWAWKEESTLQSRRAAIQAQLTQTFPKIKVVIDAPLQMEREVAALRQATGAASGQDLESILAALGVATAPDRVAMAVDYSAGEARVKGLKLNAQEATSLSDRLKTQGYAARVEADTVFVKQDIKGGTVP